MRPQSSNNGIAVSASQQECGSGHEPIPEKFLMHGVDAYSLLSLMHGVDVYSLLSSLSLLMSQGAQGFYRDWAGERCLHQTIQFLSGTP